MASSALIALTGSLATAVYFVLLAKLSKPSESVDSNHLLIVTHGIGAMVTTLSLLLWPDVPMPAVNTELLELLLLATLPLIISRKLYLYACARLDVAYVTIFSPLTPIYAIIIGAVFYHAVPTLQDVLGIFIIIAAIYFLFAARGERLLLKFRQSQLSLPVWAAFASTLPTAFAALVQKEALALVHPLLLAAIIQWAICLSLLAYALIRRQSIPLVLLCKNHFCLIAGIMFGISNICFNYVLLHEHAAVTLALQRMSSIFQILLAHLWLKEHHLGMQKCFAAFVHFWDSSYSCINNVSD